MDEKDYLLLEKYINLFYNIKIINIKSKKGIINSIYKGTKIAEGKYLMILNQNCFFLEPNTFTNIQNELEREYVDILEINLYKLLPNNYMNLYKCKHYQSRCNFTKLKYNLEVNDIDINDELLTNKLFKIKYFKDIFKKFKINEHTEINDIYYNEIISFIIDSTVYTLKTSSSINIYINEFDMNKFKFNDFTSVENNLINQTINYIDFLFDNSKDSPHDINKVLQIFKMN